MPIHSPEVIERGIGRLQERIDALTSLDVQALKNEVMPPELAALSAAIADTLERCFGKETTAYRRYKPATALRPLKSKSYSNEFYFRQEVQENCARSVALLQDAQRTLREDIEDSEHVAPEQIFHSTTLSRRVFVVHGHDGEARETTARLLKAMDFEPVILHEQANQGGTVIEKFEANSDVGFAVVLLTPDDLGRSFKEEELKPRARQNVLLELGYFIGRLGRNKVCALKRGDVELPSDYVGVVWEKMDDGGGWKLALARELKAAGHEVDLNKAFSL
jgi:predicted nucleotide-binding protein